MKTINASGWLYYMVFAKLFVQNSSFVLKFFAKD